MTSDLQGALARVEHGLAGLGRSVVLGALRPGVGAGRVHELLRSCRLSANHQVEEMYGWHDGTDMSDIGVLGDAWLIPGYYLLSAGDAVGEYLSLAERDRWDPGWLPVLANGGGDYYAVGLNGDHGGAVRHFWFDESERPLEFESLESMFSTFAAAFEQGTFYVDSEGYLEMEDLAFAALAAELNPRVPWWTEELDA